MPLPEFFLQWPKWLLSSVASSMKPSQTTLLKTVSSHHIPYLLWSVLFTSVPLRYLTLKNKKLYQECKWFGTRSHINQKLHENKEQCLSCSPKGYQHWCSLQIQWSGRCNCWKAPLTSNLFKRPWLPTYHSFHGNILLGSHLVNSCAITEGLWFSSEYVKDLTQKYTNEHTQSLHHSFRCSVTPPVYQGKRKKGSQW